MALLDQPSLWEDPGLSIPLLAMGGSLLSSSGYQPHRLSFGQALGGAIGQALPSFAGLLAQRRQQQENEAQRAALRSAFVFGASGDIDVPRTTQNLARLDPMAAMKFSQEQGVYQLGMLKATRENEEIQRRIQADQAKQHGMAQNAGVMAQYQAMQAGATEEQAAQIGQQVYRTALSQSGLAPESFNFEQARQQSAPLFGEGGESEGPLITDTGQPAQGELIQTAATAPAQVTPPGAAPLNPFESPLPARGYDWARAYDYSARKGMKNPHSQAVIYDYRTGQVIPNEPLSRAKENALTSGWQDVVNQATGEHMRLNPAKGEVLPYNAPTTALAKPPKQPAIPPVTQIAAIATAGADVRNMRPLFFETDPQTGKPDFTKLDHMSVLDAFHNPAGPMTEKGILLASTYSSALALRKQIELGLRGAGAVSMEPMIERRYGISVFDTSKTVTNKLDRLQGYFELVAKFLPPRTQDVVAAIKGMTPAERAKLGEASDADLGKPKPRPAPGAPRGTIDLTQ